MSIFSAITEAILNELNYNQSMRKNMSVFRLFPKFGQRIADVNKNGGVSLANQAPELWTFNVASGTKPGVRYAVYLKFKGIPELINKHAGNKKLWNKGETTIDYSKLAPEIMNELDLESDCNCQADLYWGGEYLKTQRKAQYDHEENRPPKIRNPKQYGLLCKHSTDVFQRLPFYTSTFANFLKKFYAQDIQNVVDSFTKEKEQFKQAGKELGKKEIKPEVKKEFKKGELHKETPEELKKKEMEKDKKKGSVNPEEPKEK